MLIPCFLRFLNGKDFHPTDHRVGQSLNYSMEARRSDLSHRVLTSVDFFTDHRVGQHLCQNYSSPGYQLFITDHRLGGNYNHSSQRQRKHEEICRNNENDENDENDDNNENDDNSKNNNQYFTSDHRAGQDLFGY